MERNLIHRLLGSAMFVASLSATGAFAQATPVGQAVRQACRAEIDAYWESHLREGYGRPFHYKNKDEIGRYDAFTADMCGPSAQNAQWLRQHEKTVEEATKRHAHWVGKNVEVHLRGAEASLMSAKLGLCVQRWLDTPQCKALLGTAPGGGAAANKPPDKPKPGVRQVQAVRREAKGSNGCIQVRAVETKPFNEAELETTIELTNTCKTEQKFDTYISVFEHPPGLMPMESWFPQNNAWGISGQAYQLWQAWMPLPKDLGFLRPKIAAMDSSRSIVPGGVARGTVMQLAFDNGRELPLADPIVVRTGSCDLMKGGRQQLVLADSDLNNFTCRFPPDPKELDRLSKSTRDGILLAQERQLKAAEERRGKGKTHAKGAEANECVKLHGNGVVGGFFNACTYPVELHYCVSQPAKGSSGHEIDCDRTNGAGIRLGVGTPFSAPVKGAARVYWFACKDGSIPVDVDYVRSKGLQGRCHGRS